MNPFDLFNIISYICMLLSLLGYYYVIKKNYIGFYYWIISNIGWIGIDLYKGIFFQALMFFIFSVVAIRGLTKWRSDKLRKEGFRGCQRRSEKLYVARGWR